VLVLVGVGVQVGNTPKAAFGPDTPGWRMDAS
jgi:hypothetical protein